MYATTEQEETIYDADNIFFEENKALLDDQHNHRQTVMTKESRTRKLTQVPKLSQLEIMQKMD